MAGLVQCDAGGMIFTEVIKHREIQLEDLLVDVVVAELESTNVRPALKLLSATMQLQRYNLEHLKRIQKSENTVGGAKVLRMVVCPVASYEVDASYELKTLFQGTTIIKVPKLAPVVYSEFEAWGKYWPLVFHAPEIERVRSIENTPVHAAEFQKRCNVYMSEVEVDNVLLRQCGFNVGGCVLVNPVTDKVVMTATAALQHLFLRADLSSVWQQPVSDCLASLSSAQQDTLERLRSHPLYQSPVLLCIDGVAALVNEDIEIPNFRSGLPPNQYICTGLVLYTTFEPDLFSSMTLLHSRIQQVVYLSKSPDSGALGSAAWLHCMPAVNHNFRVFCVEGSS